MQKPSIPKGTRDFSPDEMAKRTFIFDTIKKYFHLYGFQQIETPSMENLSTLTGKYGDEGDQLIFKILNSGDYLKDANDEKLKAKNSKSLIPDISEKALRYDLTVPFARYVVMHQNEISFPFKRYQIQPVWRADRPQKGRYREFYQCDADMIGSNSLVNEIELMQLMDDVYSALSIPVVIKINNRKILSGIAELIGESEKIIDITVAIDKLDKIGLEKVIEELVNKGLSPEAIDKLKPVLLLEGDTSSKINSLKQVLKTSETGLKGIEELEFVFTTIKNLGVKAKTEFDITLARGLNYYTGAIFEVKADAGSFSSSICGGGRYDDLTGIFGLPNMSGVGISFGADRTCDVMEELKLFPADLTTGTKVLIINFGEAEQKFCLPLLSELRRNNIRAELYPDAGAKMKKQMSYADSRNIPFALLIGSDEMSTGMFTLKEMKSGEQKKVNKEQLIALLNN
jgi:histidyl-tRNA synthetase